MSDKEHAKLIRIKQVAEQVGLSIPEIYRLIREGKFPKQIQLGVFAVAWVEAEVQDWIQGKVEATKQTRQARA